MWLDVKILKIGGMSKVDLGVGGGDIGCMVFEGRMYWLLNVGDIVGVVIIIILVGGGFIVGVCFMMIDEILDWIVK